MKIEKGLEEIDGIWTNQAFAFREWKGRNIQILLGTVGIMEELEETQMNLQAFLTMRHVAPFRERAQELLQTLSDSSDTLERWLKVQMMWCSLESVFTGGDIAKQMPMEAKLLLNAVLMKCCVLLYLSCIKNWRNVRSHLKDILNRNVISFPDSTLFPILVC